jgi:hypothetical protein
MIMMIAAALAATAPATPAATPADAHAQHQQVQQQGHMAQNEQCCCKDMMEKMHSGHDMDRMPSRQEHSGR